MNELFHYGIKGMKWGVRRFQQKNGTLTPAGKKRYASETKDKPKTPEKPKTVKEMSDDELRARVNRLQLEKQALSLSQEVSKLSPQTVSTGKRFTKSLLDDVVIPAAKDAGRTTLNNYLKKTLAKNLGLNEQQTDELSALQKEFKTKSFKKQINELDKYFEAEKKKQSGGKNGDPIDVQFKDVGVGDIPDDWVNNGRDILKNLLKS